VSRRYPSGIRWGAFLGFHDRRNESSWRAQKDRLLAVDSLRLVISVLQDSVTRLEAANAAAGVGVMIGRSVP